MQNWRHTRSLELYFVFVAIWYQRFESTILISPTKFHKHWAINTVTIKFPITKVLYILSLVYLPFKAPSRSVHQNTNLHPIWCTLQPHSKISLIYFTFKLSIFLEKYFLFDVYYNNLLSVGFEPTILRGLLPDSITFRPSISSQTNFSSPKSSTSCDLFICHLKHHQDQSPEHKSTHHLVYTFAPFKYIDHLFHLYKLSVFPGKYFLYV